MAKTAWKKGLARDVLALGSIPFFFIVTVRSIIGEFPSFLFQMLVSGALIFLVWLFFRKADYHVTRGLAIMSFTSIYYANWKFTPFAFLLWCGAVYGAFYLKRGKERIIWGVVIGAVTTGLAYIASVWVYG